MEGFEELVAEIYRADGYWVQRRVRVALSAADKRDLNNYSMPDPEIDLVAYRAGANELLAIECKSYFDSGGVHARDLMEPRTKNVGRYKMFVDDKLREMVLTRLGMQLAASGMVQGAPHARLGLIYGHATTRNEALLRGLFKEQKWFCHGPDWLRGRLKVMAARAYDSQVATAVTKLLLPRSGRSSADAGNLPYAAAGDQP